MKLTKILLSAVLAASCMFGLSGCSDGAAPGNIGNEVTFKDGDKIAEITIEGYGTIKAKLFPDIAPTGVDNFIKLAESGYYNGLKIHRVMPDMCIQGGSLNGDGTGGEALAGKDGTFPIEISENARNFYGALCYVNQEGLNTTQFYIVNSKKQWDITQYVPAVIRAEAQKFTDQKTELEENDPAEAQLTEMETYYNNLANMIEKASEEVTAKYAETGGYPLWDGRYTVFGQVFEGLDIVDSISKTALTTNNVSELSKPVTDIIIQSVKITEYVEPKPETAESSSDKKDKKKK